MSVKRGGMFCSQHKESLGKTLSPLRNNLNICRVFKNEHKLYKCYSLQIKQKSVFYYLFIINSSGNNSELD